MTDKRAIVVRGGWEGHQPVEATDLFLPFLRDNGYDVRVEDSPAVYADADDDGRDRPHRAVRDDVDDRARGRWRACGPPWRPAPASPAGTAGSPTRSATRRTTCSSSAASSPPTRASTPTSSPADASDNYLDYTVEFTAARARAPDHGRPRRLRAHDRAVLGAARRPQRRARDHHAPGAGRGTRGIARSPRRRSGPGEWGAGRDRRRRRPATASTYSSTRRCAPSSKGECCGRRAARRNRRSRSHLGRLPGDAHRALRRAGSRRSPTSTWPARRPSPPASPVPALSRCPRCWPTPMSTWC